MNDKISLEGSMRDFLDAMMTKAQFYRADSEDVQNVLRSVAT